MFVKLVFQQILMVLLLYDAHIQPIHHRCACGRSSNYRIMKILYSSFQKIIRFYMYINIFLLQKNAIH